MSVNKKNYLEFVLGHYERLSNDSSLSLSQRSFYQIRFKDMSNIFQSI